MSIFVTTAVGADLADALAAAVGSGAILEIRTGAGPGPEAAATGTLLVSITIAGAWTATDNVIAAGNPGEVLPTAAGTAAHFRLKTSGGTALLEGTVTAFGDGGDLQLTSTSIVLGVPVDLGAPSLTVPLT